MLLAARSWRWVACNDGFGVCFGRGEGLGLMESMWFERGRQDRETEKLTTIFMNLVRIFFGPNFGARCLVHNSLTLNRLVASSNKTVKARLYMWNYPLQSYGEWWPLFYPQKKKEKKLCCSSHWHILLLFMFPRFSFVFSLLFLVGFKKKKKNIYIYIWLGDLNRGYMLFYFKRILTYGVRS